MAVLAMELLGSHDQKHSSRIKCMVLWVVAGVIGECQKCTECAMRTDTNSHMMEGGIGSTKNFSTAIVSSVHSSSLTVWHCAILYC